MASPRASRSALVAAVVIASVILGFAALAVIGVEPFDNQGPRDAILCALALAFVAALVALARALSGAAQAREAARREAEEAREAARREAEEAREAARREAEEARAAARREAEEARAAARREADEARATAEHEAERAAAAEESGREAEERERQARQEAEREAREASSNRRGAALARAALERERQWTRELRSQVVAMHQARSALAPQDDTRSLVLRVALDLTDAPKGLLLGRQDEDGDGRLDVVAAEGFDEDPRASEIAQRFAERAMERDVVVREDAPRKSGESVDDEISTLIAIPMYMADQFSGVVICADRPGGFDECDDEVLLSLGDHAGTVLQNTELHGQLRSAFVSTVRLLTEAIQAKDPFLRGHSEDVADYVDAVSRQLGIDEREREQLSFASLLHDVGKIGISERILLKPGRLTPEERSVIELHPRIGFRLVEQVPGMQDIAPVILHHHERWDGGGYPARLRGEDIPLAARVVGVADAFSAMTEQRPYRDRMSLETACEELERCAGSQFDPRVVNLFTTEVREHPRRGGLGPLATALADGELEARRSEKEGVLGAGTAALTDSLTLLYSHRYFHEAAAAQAERAALQDRPFAVVLAELTALPQINRAEGYAGGDDALRGCARALSQLAVRHGAVACRVGGGRLGMLVEGVDAVAADALAEQLRQAMPAAAEVRTAAAVWEPGDTGPLVAARARAALAGMVGLDGGAPSGAAAGV